MPGAPIEKRIAIAERPRVRQFPEKKVEQPHEVRQHRGLLFADGRPFAGGRAHIRAEGNLVGVAATPRPASPAEAGKPTAIYSSAKGLAIPIALPCSVGKSVKRHTDGPPQYVKPTGRKFIPHGEGEKGGITQHLHLSPTPRPLTPQRTGRSHTPQRDHLGPRAEAPPDSPAKLCLRYMSGPPPFEPPEFRPRSYTPHKDRSRRPADSAGLLSFRPDEAFKEAQAARASRGLVRGSRAAAYAQSYDIISGKEL